MTTRTVKVLGWGINVGSATVTAILDGNTVFDGQVDLVEMTADNESWDTAPTLFTFEIPMDFVGVMPMTVSVIGAPVRFGQILTNYKEVGMGSITYSSGADNYLDIAEYDSNHVRDPRNNVMIDGEAQVTDRTFAKGTWHWTVNPGATLTHDLIVPTAGMLE